jgi:predicted enzyme related to lactoylglutathione lyase
MFLMAANAFAWVEIYVQDLERAKAFYESVFGFQLEKLESQIPMWAFPSDSSQWGAGGALVHMPGVPSGGSGTLAYFSSADCISEEGRAVAAGGSVKQTKMSIGPFGFISILVDTEGNAIGLHSMA